jgi:hypothetical protein
MTAGSTAGVNNLPIQGSADKANGVAVATSGKRHSGAHHATADYGDDSHFQNLLICNFLQKRLAKPASLCYYYNI